MEFHLGLFHTTTAAAPCLARVYSSTDPYVRSATPTNSVSQSGENPIPAVSPKWSIVCTVVNPAAPSYTLYIHVHHSRTLQVSAGCPRLQKQQKKTLTLHRD